MYVCFAWSKVMCTHTHNATQCIVIEHRCIFTAESMEEISLFLSLSIPVRCCYCCFSSFYSFCSCAYTQHSIYAHCGLAYKHELHKPLICQRSALVSTSEHEHEHWVYVFVLALNRGCSIIMAEFFFSFLYPVCCSLNLFYLIAYTQLWMLKR